MTNGRPFPYMDGQTVKNNLTVDRVAKLEVKYEMGRLILNLGKTPKVMLKSEMASRCTISLSSYLWKPMGQSSGDPGQSYSRPDHPKS